jgi:hypothetical protein
MENDNLKQLNALLSKLSEEDRKEAFDLLKASAPSNAPETGGGKVNLSATPESGGVKTNLARPIIDSSTRKKVNDAIVSSLIQNNEPLRFRTIRLPNGKEMYQPTNEKVEARSNYDLNKLDSKAAAIGKTRAEYETMPRLERMKLESAGAVAEAERRKGIRDENKLDIADVPKKGGFAGVESPSALKSRLIQEGKSENDASIAAGQRYRDMFSRPGDHGSAQDKAYFNAATPEDRSRVLQGLKDARKDNLQALTAARLNDPNRKEVGVVTKMETSDGHVLAQRGESEDGRTATSGVAGATGSINDTYGALKYNGGNNIKEALNSYNNKDSVGKPNVPVYYEGTNTPSMTLQDPKKQEMAVAPPPTVTKTDEGLTVIKGIYGGGISRPKDVKKPDTDKIDKSPSVPSGFQKNPDGKVVATQPDPLSNEQLAKNQKAALEKAAGIELKKRESKYRRGV